jgi:hypothetical protein
LEASAADFVVLVIRNPWGRSVAALHLAETPEKPGESAADWMRSMVGLDAAPAKSTIANAAPRSVSARPASGGWNDNIEEGNGK